MLHDYCGGATKSWDKSFPAALSAPVTPVWACVNLATLVVIGVICQGTHNYLNGKIFKGLISTN